MDTPTRIELQELAKRRLEEANTLVKEGFYDGAVYLASYALELALKACICKILATDYPSSSYKSFYTHKYDELILLAGLTAELPKKQADPNFNANWSILFGSKGWSEGWRYRKINSVNQQDAEDFIDALENPQSGVLISWLATIW